MNKVLKSLLKGSSTIAFMTMAAAIFGFLIRMVLARELSLEDFGLFYSVLALLIPVGLLKNLGVNRALIKFIPEFLVKEEWGKIKESIHWAFIVSMSTALITAGMFYFLSDWLESTFFNTDMAAPFFRIMLIYFIVSTPANVFTSVFNGMRKPFLLSARPLFTNGLIFIVLYIATDLNQQSVSYRLF